MTLPVWISGDEPIPDPYGYGRRAVNFIERLRLTEGKLAGQRFKLPEWQKNIVLKVYGDVREDGRRKVRTVFLYLPRGNGKTTFTSALALLHLIGPEREAAGQVMCAAADREQAAICFNSAHRMILQSKQLLRVTRVKESVREILHKSSASKLKAISRDSRTKHGMSISFLSADEVHAWKDRDLWDVLRSSMLKREQPLTMVTTTAGHGRESFAWDLYDYASKVAAGDVVDDTFLPILFQADPDDDIYDPAIWRKANPAIVSGFTSTDYFETMAERARESSAERRIMEQLHLNLWQDGHTDPWVELDVWDEGADDFTLEALELHPCWIGVDLSSTGDLTAVVAVWRVEGEFFVVPWLYVPEDALDRRERRDEAPYRTWVDDEAMYATPGAVVDYDVIEDRIRSLCERFDVREISFDRWHADAIKNHLIAESRPIVDCGQGFATMSGLSKATESALLQRQVRHLGNPVLRWCMANVRMDMDAAGNIKPAKNKSVDRIDGVVAMIMALGRASQATETSSIWETWNGDDLVL